MKKFPRKDRKHKPSHGPARNQNPQHGRNQESHGQHHGSQRAQAGDERRKPRFSREVGTLYEDDAVIVVDKPAGLLSVPIVGSDVASALSVLQDALREKKQRPLVVHRIDRFASGILLFAKTNHMREQLVEQFLEHTPVREYLAVVRGRLKEEEGTLVHHFKREGMFQQLRSSGDPTATRAELRYTVERVFADATLVRVELVTGLQNQIRAQFAAIGHPLVGDRKYHRQEEAETLINRVALHAAHLEFVHPRTGEPVAIDCRPPKDFQELVRELGKPSRARR